MGMTTAPTRVAAGVPTGGQFAATAHAEGAIALPAASSPDAAALSQWGEQLERKIKAAAEEWAMGCTGGTDQADCTELLDLDEDRTIAAYGEGRSDWLHRLSFEVEGNEYQTYAGSWDGPAEYAMRGRTTVRSGGKVIDVVDFTHEDPPQLGALLEHCPADPLPDSAIPVTAPNECPACGGNSDQNHGIPCSSCMSNLCIECFGELDLEGRDGLCGDCAEQHTPAHKLTA